MLKRFLSLVFCVIFGVNIAIAQNQMINSNIVVQGTINYGTDVGASDSYAISLNPPLINYVNGGIYCFKANTANTGPASLNINSLGAKTIKKWVSGILTDLSTNDIGAGRITCVYYDGTFMQTVLGTESEAIVNLTGDVTTSGGNVTTVEKVHGVTYPASPSTHGVPLVTAADTVVYKVIPDCDDGAGHINYDTATQAFTCGTQGVEGGGNVSNSGTPTTGQAAEWTSATVIQGVATTGTGNYVKATSPTITTPTIGSFANAGHNHTNAAGGGQITDASLSAAVTVPKGGTGATTLTGVLVGNGVSAVTTIAAPSGDIVGTQGIQTLQDKTLESSTLNTPTIASFINAEHDHQDLTGGGQITDAALSTAVTVPKGGTGLTAGTSGGVPYFSGTTTIASSGALTANLPVIGGGAGGAPTVGTRSGNTTQFVTTTGTLTDNDCVRIDANGNFVGAGSPCGSGGGGVGTAGAPIFTQTATTTVTSTSEATLLGSGVGTLTIPANWFSSAGASLKIEWYGRFSTTTVPGTQRIRLKFGSTVILDTGAYALTGSITNGVAKFTTVITARTVGATGTVIAESIFETTGTALVPNEAKMLNTATITIDTTATQVVDLTNLFDTSGNSISTEVFTMYSPGSSVSSVNGRTGAVVDLLNDPGGNGIVSRTASMTTVGRTLTGTFPVTVTNGDGVAGNPTVACATCTTNDGTQTLTNKQINPRVVTLTDGATVTPNLDTTDEGVLNTLSQDTTIANPTGTPVDGRSFILRITSSAIRALTWGDMYSAAPGIPLPVATTGGGTVDYYGFRYNSNSSKLDFVAATEKIVKVEKLWLEGGKCNSTSATTIWSTTPTSGFGLATCLAGTNTHQGAMDFANDSVRSIQTTYALPDDWTSTIDAKFKWFTSGTAGNMVWQIATVCVADGETDDPAFNTPSVVVDATKGTANQTNDAVITGIDTTGCAAGELMHIKVLRDPAHANDDLAATARLKGLELTIRRTP